METANVFVAIGGDRRNTVPKYNVTVAEVEVLRFIHGEDAVFDIELLPETVKRTHRQEIGRLTEKYGRQEGEARVSPAVATLYPGSGARVPETFEDLDLPDELFIAIGRKTTASKPAKVEEPEGDGLDDMSLKQLQAHAQANNIDLAGVTRKADVIEAIRMATAAQADTDDQDEDDGVGDMADKNLFE
ncbi:MAG: Rho termination factor N-terminal domain-containing protein [Aquidulcibacter sp.]